MYMSMLETKLPFEMAEIDEDNVVFIKSISKSGKSPKQIKEIKAKLRKTTIQYFTDADFEKLKEIESRLILKQELPNQKRAISFLSVMKRFLEI